MPAPVRLAILWHMHQPYYLDPVTGESVLPWVRLHALKDYWGMVALVHERPAMRATFNLVPALVEQIEAYASERTWDRQLVLGLRDPALLDSGEAAWFVREAFHAHPPTMIEPHARYAELWRLAMDGASFDPAALRDLQVWQKLVWIDADLGAADPRVRSLMGRGRGFDEHDKAALRQVELDVLRRVVPAYREAAATGRVELSCSPYFHPILPLLCDSAAHHDVHPGAPLPDPPFRWPEDADAQLTRAAAAHERWFGARPGGVWPSEGAISQAAAEAIARAGFRWMASDEDVLRRSRTRAGLAADDLAPYRPHVVRTPHGDVHVGFRDHGLSDAIGFTYQRWPTAAAIDDVIGRLEAIGARCQDAGAREAVVFVILDGENAWEHYPGGGRPFLRDLYRRVTETPWLTPVTMGEAATGDAATLPALSAGSWIHGDLDIWIGHADDRRAWGQLGDARRRLDGRRHQVDVSRVREAEEAIFAAEGSDWFWWYGDDHASSHDREFDALFRRHLRRAWHALGDDSAGGVASHEHHHGGRRRRPAGPRHGGGLRSRPGGQFLRPAGHGGLERPAGAMHRVADGVFRRCDVGATDEALAIWCDVAPGAEPALEVIRPDGLAPTVALAPAGRSDVAWTSLDVPAGGAVRIRVVARDAAGRVIATVPADGLGRRVERPGSLGATWTA
ncbi:MAG: glycoside hydrolase family 57 protein [Vicinamibacterales bacterium]